MAMIEAALSSQTAQLTNTLLMVRPDSFGYNDQTASTNAFQNNSSAGAEAVRRQAISEFGGAVHALRRNGIKVIVCPSRVDVPTPDAVFPNNWVSFHSELNGTKVIVYPMLAPNRREERQLDNVSRFVGLVTNPSATLDLTHHETLGGFLEGTGSLIFNRRAKVVFAHESARTSYQVLDDFCGKTGYQPVKFHAQDEEGKPIYHTNVIMSIGEGFSVVCLEAIKDRGERIRVENALEQLHEEIIPIGLEQMHSFCGNILEVRSVFGRNKIIMSITAFDAFTQKQRSALLNYGDIVPLNIPTIEEIGGGSARCMLAEVF